MTPADIITSPNCTLKSVMLKVSNKTDNRKIKGGADKVRIKKKGKKRRPLQPDAVKCAKSSNFFNENQFKSQTLNEDNNYMILM